MDYKLKVKDILGGPKILLSRLDNTDEQCINAFVSLMNKTAKQIGMTGSQFKNPSGIPESGHYSTANDMLKLGCCFSSHGKLMSYDGWQTYSVPIGGNHARTITVDCTYKGDSVPALNAAYHIFGGKSGSWGDTKNLLSIVKSKTDDAWLVGCVMNASDSDRSVAMKQLLDWLEEYRSNPSVQSHTVNASYASACVLPVNNPYAYRDVTIAQVTKNAGTQYTPYSMTKLLTAIVIFDNFDINGTLTIKASDITEGSGPLFYKGDTISIEDAIIALLLPSSNTLAVALARHFGYLLLNK